MGYWEQGTQGYSFHDAETDEEMLWGDRPADIVDDALVEIKEAFVRDVERPPTKAEILAGLVFSLEPDTDVPDGMAWPYRNRTVPPAHIRALPTDANVDAACAIMRETIPDVDAETMRTAVRALLGWVNESALTDDPTPRIVWSDGQTGPRADG